MHIRMQVRPKPSLEGPGPTHIGQLGIGVSAFFINITFHPNIIHINLTK